jgi:hypothetical protein
VDTSILVYNTFCCCYSCRWDEILSLNWGYLRAYCWSPRWHIWVWSCSGMIFTGENRRTERETCPCATLSTTNPIWSDLGMNTGLRGERSVTTCLSHDMAYNTSYILRPEFSVADQTIVLCTYFFFLQKNLVSTWKSILTTLCPITNLIIIIIFMPFTVFTSLGVN